MWSRTRHLVRPLPVCSDTVNNQIAWLAYNVRSRANLWRVWRTYSSDAPSTRPKVIFSGIQPTGVPHLGNYLGALRQWVNLQNEADESTKLIWCLVDLHAITVRQEAKQLRQWKNESLAMLLAIGLDPKRSTLFHQSDVAGHAELMWILSCQASTGYLGRMTQWKDKTANEKENSEKLKLGLFSYPVLQAADVLVHGATHVPVGHDQAQHLEFTREVAIGFNHIYGKDLLVSPETLISPAKRIMSLTDPIAKMSKSHPNPKSRILLTDSEAEISSKVRAAVTDSHDSIDEYNPDCRPGVSNLIDLLLHTSPNETYESQSDVVRDLQGSSYKAVKEKVAESVNKTVHPIRERYRDIVNDRHALREISSIGAEQARHSASATMRKIRRAIGFD